MSKSVGVFTGDGQFASGYTMKKRIIPHPLIATNHQWLLSQKWGLLCPSLMHWQSQSIFKNYIYSVQACVRACELVCARACASTWGGGGG